MFINSEPCVYLETGQGVDQGNRKLGLVTFDPEAPWLITPWFTSPAEILPELNDIYAGDFQRLVEATPYTCLHPCI